VVMDALSLAVADEPAMASSGAGRKTRRASTGSMEAGAGDNSAPEGAAASKARLKEAQQTLEAFAGSAYEMIIERLQPAHDAMGEGAPAFSDMQDRLKYVRFH
jgi:hypothetical protein